MAYGNKTTIDIDGNNKGAVLSINGVKQSLNSLGNYVGGPFGSIMTGLSRHLALAGVSTGIAALVHLTKQAIDTAETFEKMSQRVGVSVEALSTLKYAAEISALPIDKLETALKKLSANLYDVSKGVGQTVSYAFNDLNIEVTDTNGKLRLTEDVLLEVADKFSKMSDGTNKTALAVKLFGRAGTEMIPMLNQGREGITALTEEARKLGLEISTETAKNAARFKDNILALERTIQGVGLSIADELLPYLVSLSSALKNYAVETRVASKTSVGLVDALKGITTGLFTVYTMANTTITALGTFYATMATFFSTGSFSKSIKMIEFGADEIKNKWSDLSNFFDSLWSKSSTSLDSYMSRLDEFTSDGNDGTASKIKKLYDQFGHPIDAEGNLKDVEKYAENMANALKKGFDNTQFSNLPTYDMSQVLVPDFNPFEGIQYDAAAFFDYYSSRGAEMRQITTSIFGNMTNAMQNFYQSGGKNASTYFAFYKAFAKGQAIISGINAVMGAYAEGNKYGGPILGAIYAATAAVYSASQIAAINSATMGGSSSGSSPSSVSSSSTTTTSSSSSSEKANYTPGQNVTNIIIYGNVVDHDKFARELVPAINKAIADGV